MCQVGGKPNQKIPAAPLRLLPTSGEPFKYILIHCVGPLPRCKSGNQYFLTMMCAVSTFPEAVFSWKVTASAISNALINFFQFGLPKVVQSDQRLFSQVFKQLSIQQMYHVDIILNPKVR